MKSKIFVILALFLATTAIGGAFLDYFQAKSESDNIRLEWKTGEEINLKHFIVERKSINSDFVSISTIQAKGSNSYYVYVDENAYKPNDVVFVYRIRIVENDNSFTYSKEITVSHGVSGIKRTWGSIKAMFR